MPAGHNLPVSVPGGADTIVFQVNALRALYQYSNLATSYLFPSTSPVKVASKSLVEPGAEAMIPYFSPPNLYTTSVGSH
jgi:hypothetical protein